MDVRKSLNVIGSLILLLLVNTTFAQGSLKDAIATEKDFCFEFFDSAQPIIGTFRVGNEYSGHWHDSKVTVTGYNGSKKNSVSVSYDFSTSNKSARKLSLWGLIAFLTKMDIYMKMGQGKRLEEYGFVHYK